MTDPASTHDPGAAPGEHVVDTHIHVWDVARPEHAWTRDIPAIHRSFHLGEAQQVLATCGVRSAVLVETVNVPGETERLLAGAAATGGDEVVVSAVVGWVDLTSPDVEDRAASLLAGPGGHLLRGVRHQVQLGDADWLLQPAVAAGLADLARLGLHFELLVRAHQLPACVEAVRRHPSTAFVLDHAGKPPLDAAGFSVWRADLARLAAQPNVVVKVSGLLSDAPAGTDPRAAVRAVDACLELFGPSRCCFGSDWPVLLAATTYRTWLDLVRSCLRHLAPGEREQVLHGTAATTYRLTGPVPA